MKVSMTAGWALSAELSTDHPSSSYGRPVLVLGGSVALGPRDVGAERFEVLDLAPGEALALCKADFMLPLAEGTRDAFRIVFMLEALCRDANVDREDGESWRTVADRCPESVRDVVVYMVELLCKLRALETFGQMSSGDKRAFSRERWADGVDLMYPDLDGRTILDWLERLISEECQTRTVQ